jgi:hypothetical protein
LVLLFVLGHVVLTARPGVASTETFLDVFDVAGYSNDDGSLFWDGPWSEIGEATDPTSGNWTVTQDGSHPGFAVRKTGQDDNGLVRMADLSGFTTATLHFDYRREQLVEPKSMLAQVSSSGTDGPWTTLYTIDGHTPHVTDDSYQPVSVDISAHISPSTAIRFLHPAEAGAFGAHMAVFVDNVEISGELTNNPPVLAGVGSLVGDEGSLIAFTASATDPDSDGLVFSLAGAVPSGASITAGGVFSWTPSETQGPGSYVFDVVVSDTGSPVLTDIETITITVNEVNQAPVLASPGDQTDGEGGSVSLQLVATDPDVPMNTLSWDGSGLPSGLSLGGDGMISGLVAAAAAEGSPYVVTVSVSDGAGLSDEVSFSWVITDTNNPPVLAGVGSLVGDEGSLIGFTASATDPDSDGLVFSLAGAVPSGASIAAGGVFSWTPSETQGPGSYVFDVVVSDTGSPVLTDIETITITVNEVNQAPVLVPPVESDTEQTPVEDDDSEPDDSESDDSESDDGLPVPAKNVMPTPRRVVDDEPPGTSGESNAGRPANPLRGAGLIVPGAIAGGPLGATTSMFGAIKLFTRAFFQTVLAMDIPTLLLGFAAIALVGLRGVSKHPVLFARRSQHYWAVVMLGREEHLGVHKAPDADSSVLYKLGPSTQGISGTGEVTTAGGRSWVGVTTPAGDGWVDGYHVTEQVDPKSFIHDSRPKAILEEFVGRLRSGRDVSDLVADRGLVLILADMIQVLGKPTLTSLLSAPSDTAVLGAGWSASDFHLAVVEPLINANANTRLLSPHVAHAETSLLPLPMRNFRYMALGGSGAQQWLIFFEYLEGKPKIVGLTIDE